MDPLSLPLGQSLVFSEDHPLCPAGYPPGDSLTCEQAASGLPGKAIGLRNCTLDRPDVSDNPQNHPGDRRATLHQQEPEPQTNDDDSSWQVVSRRRSRRQRSPGTASAGKRTDKNGAQAKAASVSSMMSSAYWSVCTNSFVGLGRMNWATFYTLMVSSYEHSPASFTELDFLRFHRLMQVGPQIVRQTEDLFFLAGPFKVLLPSRELSLDTTLLSLLFERASPGFVKLLGDRFVSSLSAVDRKHGKLFTAVTEILVQICQTDPHWLDRLGWQKLGARHQCSLFSTVSFLLKESKRIQLVRNLHQRVSWSWLQDCHYAVVQKMLCEHLPKHKVAWVRDLKASVRALSCWLEVRFFITGEIGERYRLVASYADMVESIIGAMDHLDPPPSRSLLGLWQAIAHWSFYFRNHFREYLGFDKAITLLDGMLRHIHRWPELESLAFELRMSLLGTVVIKCESLLLRRNSVAFFKAWQQHRDMLPPLFTRCGDYMKDYRPPFAINDQSVCAQHKEDAGLLLSLREFNYHRLDCESRKVDREFIQKKMQLCREAYDTQWKLSDYHREMGTLELAKWCFMAAEHEAGVTCLVGVCFKLHSMSWKKADLLARNGAYQAAVDEYHHTRALMANSDATDPRKLDSVDDRIAMAQMRQYQAGHNTDQLISAYRLSVDVLGRCDSRDRVRFEGGLARIVNAMKKSGLRFDDYAGPTKVLGYLVKDGHGIKSWDHFANLLYIRHKLGLTDAGSVDKVAEQINGGRPFFLGKDKMS